MYAERFSSVCRSCSVCTLHTIIHVLYTVLYDGMVMHILYSFHFNIWKATTEEINCHTWRFSEISRNCNITTTTTVFLRFFCIIFWCNLWYMFQDIISHFRNSSMSMLTNSGLFISNSLITLAAGQARCWSRWMADSGEITDLSMARAYQTQKVLPKVKRVY